MTGWPRLILDGWTETVLVPKVSVPTTGMVRSVFVVEGDVVTRAKVDLLLEQVDEAALDSRDECLGREKIGKIMHRHWIPRRFSICSSGTPLVSGMSNITQSNCPSMQAA